MYLSRIWLNPRRSATRAALVELQRLHAAVLAGFAPGSDPGRPLWRLDPDPIHGVALFIVSSTPPSLEHVAEQFGWPSCETGQGLTRNYDKFLGSISRGDQFAFRLTANPTVSLSDRSSGRRRGHVVPLKKRDEQLDWLEKRSAAAGFRLAIAGSAESVGMPSLPDLRLVNREQAIFGRSGGRSSSKVTLERATFEGRLFVTDVDAIRGALTSGIGRAKGYGCGLMTLAPIQGMEAV